MQAALAEAVRPLHSDDRCADRSADIGKDAHAAHDAAVLAAYGFDPKKDLLEQLLALNLEVAARISGGQPVTPPGAPAAYGDPTPLITNDRIRP
jgi:hypothetical protein